jgi:hypothetical protein
MTIRKPAGITAALAEPAGNADPRTEQSFQSLQPREPARSPFPLLLCAATTLHTTNSGNHGTMTASWHAVSPRQSPRLRLGESAEAQPNKRNEANGILGKLYRLNWLGDQLLLARGNLRNKANGILGRLCRLNGATGGMLGDRANRENKANGILGKPCRLNRTGRGSCGGLAKRRNKAIAVIADRRTRQSCVHLCPAGSSFCRVGATHRAHTLADGLHPPHAPAGSRRWLSRSGYRDGRGQSARRPFACLTRPFAPITMSAWLDQASLVLPAMPASDHSD